MLVHSWLAPDWHGGWAAGSAKAWKGYPYSKHAACFITKRAPRQVLIGHVLCFALVFFGSFGFASILVSLLLCRLLKLRTRSRLRAAHRRILSATDRIGWASSLAGTKIASTSSLSSQRIPSRPSTEDYDGCGPPGRVWSALADTESPTRPEPAGGQELTELARKNSIPGPDDESEVVEPLQELGISLISNSELDDTSSDASALSARSQTSADAQMLIAAGEAEMLSSEAELQKAKRELSWLRWERWGLWADGSFVGWELVAPHKEKEALEAWTSVFSSLVAIARLWSEALRSE